MKSITEFRLGQRVWALPLYKAGRITTLHLSDTYVGGGYAIISYDVGGLSQPLSPAVFTDVEPTKTVTVDIIMPVSMGEGMLFRDIEKAYKVTVNEIPGRNIP